MSSFFVLDAAIEDERRRWLGIWDAWTSREVFAHPAYVELFTQLGEKALCAVLEVDRVALVLFPFILRPLSNEPWVGLEDYSACDLTTPYGYGGAYSVSSADCQVDEFWDSFDVWCKLRNVVTLFVRLPVFEHQVIHQRMCV